MFPEEYPFFEAVPLDKSTAHRCAGFADQLEIGEAVKREKGAYALLSSFSPSKHNKGPPLTCDSQLHFA